MNSIYARFHWLQLGSLCALLATAPAGAATAPAANATLIQKLTSCAEVADKDARLACYDNAAAALKTAESRGDVVVIDREQARSMRRQAFGLNLPSLSLFDRGERPETLDKIGGRLAGAGRDGTGRWTFRLEDGAAWTQVDSDMVMVNPRAGMPVEIKKGMMGSFFLSLDGHAGVRVRRIQ